MEYTFITDVGDGWLDKRPPDEKIGECFFNNKETFFSFFSDKIIVDVATIPIESLSEEQKTDILNDRFGEDIVSRNDLPFEAEALFFSGIGIKTVAVFKLKQWKHGNPN